MLAKTSSETPDRRGANDPPGYRRVAPTNVLVTPPFDALCEPPPMQPQDRWEHDRQLEPEAAGGHGLDRVAAPQSPAPPGRAPPTRFAVSPCAVPLPPS